MKKTSITAGFVYLTLSSILYIGAGYLVNVLPGKILGPASYGIFGIVNTIMTSIALTQTSGIPQAVSKFIAEKEDDSQSILKSGLTIQIFSSVAVTLLYLLSAPLIAAALHDPSLTQYLMISSLIIPTYGLYTLTLNYYNGTQQFKKQSLYISLYAVIKIIAIIGLLSIFGLVGAIIGYAIAPLIVLLISFRKPSTTKKYPYKPLIFFALPIIAFTVFTTLQQSIDLYLLKSLTRSNELSGFYTAAQNIARIPLFALSAMSTLLFPSVASSMKRSVEETKILITNGLRYSLLLLLPITGFIAVYARSFLSIIYDDQYKSVTEPLAVLVIGMAFLTIFTILSNVISAGGKPMVTIFHAGVGVVLIIVSGIVLIPQEGVLGAAIATVIGCFVSTVLSLLYIKNQFHLKLPVFSYIRTIFITAFVSLIIGQVAGDGLSKLLILCAVYSISYITLLILLGEITLEEKNHVHTLLLRLRRKH
jgi:stage V sporulation protein B